MQIFMELPKQYRDVASLGLSWLHCTLTPEVPFWYIGPPLSEHITISLVDQKQYTRMQPVKRVLLKPGVTWLTVFGVERTFRPTGRTSAVDLSRFPPHHQRSVPSHDRSAVRGCDYLSDRCHQIDVDTVPELGEENALHEGPVSQ
jgi:hypothetical protein